MAASAAMGSPTNTSTVPKQWMGYSWPSDDRKFLPNACTTLNATIWRIRATAKSNSRGSGITPAASRQRKSCQAAAVLIVNTRHNASLFILDFVYCISDLCIIAKEDWDGRVKSIHGERMAGEPGSLFPFCFFVFSSSCVSAYHLDTHLVAMRGVLRRL